jgi:hypothetical protein
VSSQRQPAVRDDTTPAAIAEPALEVRLVVEPAPAPAPVPPALGEVEPLAVEVAAEVTPHRPAEGDPRSFLGAVRAEGPGSFGALLDAALSLGS